MNHAKKPLTILFIPLIEINTYTSVRTPSILRILSKHYNVVGVKPPRILSEPYTGKKALWILKRLMLLIYLLENIKVAIKNKVNLVFCEEPDYALIGVVISKILRIPLIYDSHGNKYLLSVRLNQPLIYRLYIVFVDLISAMMSTSLLVVSEYDKNYYIKQGIKPEKIHVLPSFIDLNEVAKAKAGSLKYFNLFKGKRILCFHGTLSYPPNLEAILFINNELAPALENFENVEIYICGRAPKSDITHLIGKLHNKVKWLGFVPNIYEVLHAADIYIAPVWRGVGIIVKVLDAMATGKPIIVTRFIKEGIPELNEKNAFIANNKTEFIQYTKYLIEHYEEYKHVGQELVKIVETKYSSEAIEKQLCFIVEKILSLHQSTSSEAFNAAKCECRQT